MPAIVRSGQYGRLLVSKDILVRRRARAAFAA